MHICSECKYYYETLSNEQSSPVYDALMDAVREIVVEHNRPCCGYHPGGVILDNESPRCKYFDTKVVI